MQECEHKFDKNNNFSKNTNILQEVGTNSRIHTFRMQAYAENISTMKNTCPQQYLIKTCKAAQDVAENHNNLSYLGIQHKFDEKVKFSKIRHVLQEVGTKCRIHTFSMQNCAENYEKTSNEEKVIVRGAGCCSPTWCCLLS